MSAYADTSFLVSLYTPDAYSAAAAARMDRQRASLYLTPFGELELTNALQLRLHRQELTAAEVEAAYRAFQEDLGNGVFSSKAIPPAVFDRARHMARRRTSELGTRTLDILHVASALLLRADVFYTFDHRQRDLARAEGLKTPDLLKPGVRPHKR